MKNKTKIISGILFFVLCLFSFAAGILFASSNRFAYKQGYATGYLDLAKDIKAATESNPDTENRDCKPLSAMKWVSVSVCTINDIKIVKVTG